MTHQRTGSQPRALAHAVHAYATHIDDPSVLAGALRHTAMRHCSVGVRAEHYPIIGRHLIAAIREVLGEILDYTYKAFAATDYEAARHIEPVEEVVDDLVATLRANHIRRVRDGQCTVYAGLTFLDILVNVERIADQCSNVGVFTLSMFDEHIMNNHHDYIQALHQGKDPVFNRAYQEAHDKYFGELKRIERSK